MRPEGSGRDGSAVGAQPIRIERVRVRDLHTFARRFLARAREHDVIPISEPRARAQSRNPYADPDDIGLLVAYGDGRCIGHLGVLPGLLQVGRSRVKVHWMTTFFVSPELRGQRIGARLLSALLDLRYDVFATAFTPTAGRVLTASGFTEFGPVGFRTVDLRRAAPWTAPIVALQRGLRLKGKASSRAAKFARRLARWTGAPSRDFLYALLIRSYEALSGSVRGVEVQSISQQTCAGMDMRKYHFVREAEVVNWMLRNPWLVESSHPPVSASARYHFKHVLPTFRRIAIELRSSAGECRGYLILSVAEVRERRVLRILAHHLVEEGDYYAAITRAFREARTYGADSLVFPDSFGPFLQRGVLLRLLTRQSRRMYLFHPGKPDGLVSRSMREIQLSYCDGDTAFT